ncbi:MAG: hypothetical protein IKZ48_10805, partial [Prevotella sp.]|nr:hypothetical protein [Prevotella sp.]
HEDGTLWGYDGVPFFSDFKGKNLKYHNAAFWQNVQKGWIDKQVAENALNILSFGTLLDKVQFDGVHLLYKGYSWWFTTSWNCQLWEAVYTNGTKNEEQNLHHAVYNEEVERNMKDLKFDVRTMGQTTENYLGFFNNDSKYRWVIRHATGKELASNGKFDVKQPIQGVTEVYRYYAKYPQEWSRDSEEPGKPEITQTEAAPNNDRTKWKRTAFTGRGYYNLGDVYRDENGHRWFVVNIAGRDDQNPINPEHPDKDENPVAELVSFEGLTAINSNSQVSNLPTFDQAVRATFYLHNLFSNSADQTDDNLDGKPGSRVVKHIIEYANVDARRIFQTVVRKGSNGRRYNKLASVAYRDDAVTNGQPLFRVTNLIGLDAVTNQTSPYHFWKHYVANPDTVTTQYTSDKFGTERILLQHIAKTDFVKKYAKDVFALWPLGYISGGDPNTERNYRTQTDARAENVTNYYYDKNVFNSFTFPGGMWNEPILMFRVTAVYDRGKDDHATITIDGHTLTLVKTARMFVLGEGADTQEDLDENIMGAYAMIECEDKNLHSQYDFLNGAQFTPSTWSQAWQW